MTTTLPAEGIHESGGVAPLTMRAARLHQVGEPMVIEQVDRPRATGTDVIV
jgi:hypothetical protein